MGKTLLVCLWAVSVASGAGCARLRVEAPKDPIKVDISMRLDIYQHLEKAIDKIEDMVSPNADQAPSAAGKQSFLDVLLPKQAYAADAASDPEIDTAVSRRKGRLAEIVSLLRKGVAGENRLGLLELRRSASGGEQEIIKSENADRLTIYRKLASQNGVPLEEIEKLYAKRLQESIPVGSPVEVFDTDKGAYVWRIK
ncbi:MAG: DUF1318 domain-containing protein [Candidatus Omnitrophota bacterium]